MEGPFSTHPSSWPMDANGTGLTWFDYRLQTKPHILRVAEDVIHRGTIADIADYCSKGTQKTQAGLLNHLHFFGVHEGNVAECGLRSPPKPLQGMEKIWKSLLSALLIQLGCMWPGKIAL